MEGEEEVVVVLVAVGRLTPAESRGDRRQSDPSEDGTRNPRKEPGR